MNTEPQFGMFWPTRGGFRTRLLSISFFLLVLFSLCSVGWIEVSLRPAMERRAVDDLLHNAATTRMVLAEVADRELHRSTALDETISALSTHAGIRLTLINANGEVVADSEPIDPIAQQNLQVRDRPEIQAVLNPSVAEYGAARRTPPQVDREMLFVAVRFPDASQGPGVLRVAMPAERADSPVWSIYKLLAVALAAGLAVMLMMTGLASSMMSRDVEALLQHTAALANGEPLAPLHMRSSVELAGIAGTIDQISQETQRAIRALADERRRSAAVLKTMREGLLSVDGEGKLTLVNPAGTSLIGLTADHLGQSIDEACGHPVIVDLIRSARRDGHAIGELSLSDGTEVDGEGPRVIQAWARVGEEGDCVVSLHEITHIRRLETIRRDFVANVSHELRTPVSIVQASAEALQDGAIDDPRYAAQFIDAILRNTERLRLLTEDILQLSRIEAGHIGVDLEAVYIDGVVADVADILSPRATTRRQTITTDVPDDIEVLADAGGLEQVLVNLLENAMKYTPEGGHIAITVERREGARIRLRVTDNGPGIPAAHRSRLFERFYRVDPGRSRAIGGTGLGLAIVKHLAEAMGGSVGMEPNRPSGSVFWIELAEAPPAEPVAEDLEVTATGEPSPVVAG